MQFYTPLRYPGGKGRLAYFMKDVLVKNRINDGTYVEPYAGGAGIALALLLEEYVWTVVINDIDIAIYSFWRCLLNKTEWLLKMISDTPVTVEEWHRQKNIFVNESDAPSDELGFSAFFLNRTNRSGILKGGVIGGKGQNSKYKLDARFKKKELSDRIIRIARHRNRIELYNLDAVELLEVILPKIRGDALFYLDPPYYEKGGLLYTNYYKPNDHAEIAEKIKRIPFPWVVTYDDALAISNLYKGIASFRYLLTYSAHSERFKGAELMFYHGIDIPLYLRKMRIPYFSRERIMDLSRV